MSNFSFCRNVSTNLSYFHLLTYSIFLSRYFQSRLLHIQWSTVLNANYIFFYPNCHSQSKVGFCLIWMCFMPFSTVFQFLGILLVLSVLFFRILMRQSFPIIANLGEIKRRSRTRDHSRYSSDCYVHIIYDMYMYRVFHYICFH